MHRLSIVHLDIKNTNIMYSKSYQKIVFLDFGTSFCIKNKVGFKKTLNSFYGTYLYASCEMKKLMNRKKR